MRTLEELDRVLASYNAAAVAHFFEGAAEEERKRLAPHALAWYSAANPMRDLRPGREAAPVDAPPAAKRPEAFEPARVAVLATAPWGQIKRLGLMGIPEPENAYAILNARRPPWLGSWAKMVCDTSFNTHWLFLRRMEREGMIARPESARYWVGMAVNVPHNASFRTPLWVVGRDAAGQVTSLSSLSDPRPRPEPLAVKTLLRADPDLLVEHLFRMFEDEEAMSRVASGDAFFSKPEDGHRRWDVALLELVAEGSLPRGLLLDATLDGLSGAAQRSARWFKDLHDRLAPTLEERDVRLERHLRLLSSRAPAAIDCGFEALSALSSAGRVSWEALAEHLVPPLAAKTKGVAFKALRLLESAARQEPGGAAQLAVVATEAFENDAPEVHERALVFILKHGSETDAALIQALKRKIDRLAPSCRARAVEWLSGGTAVETPPAGETSSELDRRIQALDPESARLAGVDIALSAFREGGALPPALTLESLSIPRLDPGAVLQPLENLDDLIDLFLRILEGEGNGDAIERALDGVLRLVEERPEDFPLRTSALRKRAFERLQSQGSFHRPSPFLGLEVLEDLAAVVLSWTDGVAVEPVRVGTFSRKYRYSFPWGQWESERKGSTSVRSFLSQRLLAIARRIAVRRKGVLLATPTHAGGWIDGRVLRNRWSQAEGTDLFDQVQALLRLAPDHRNEALESAHEVAGEFGAALRYALSGEEEIGPTAALWVAAARARSPHRDDPRVEARHPGLGPDGGRAARYHFKGAHAPRWSGPEKVVRIEHEPEGKYPPATDLPTVLLHCRNEWVPESRMASSWEGTVWPLARESFFAYQAAQATAFLESQGTYWLGDWEPLFDPDVPLKAMGRLLLILGLAARHPNAARLALDGLLAAIEDGRLDGPGLGETMTGLLSTESITLGRWIKAFQEAAAVSPLHQQVLRAALEHALPALPENATVVAPLELLRQWSVEAGEAISLPESRKRLEGVRGGGKTAQLARALLTLTSRPSGTRARAAVIALERRIERAERYQLRRDVESLSAPTA